MKTILSAVLIAFLMIGFVARAAEPTLKLGDPAPKLSVGKWVKGEPVAGFEKGKVYVVEFWATWCGPCKVAIPHVTENAKKYADKGVVFIGQNCWERDDKLVEPFVAEMGDKMGYRVVFDDKTTDAKGAMATTWMMAAGRNGIPCTFIINQESQVAWIGHPMTMDVPLEKIVAGTWDIKQAQELLLKENVAREASTKWNKDLAEARTAKNWDKVIAMIDQRFAEDKNASPMLNMTKYMALVSKEDKAAATALAESFLGKGTTYAPIQASIASMIASKPGEIDAKDLDLALKLAEQANTSAQGKTASYLNILASVQFKKGDKAKAIELQKQAVQLSTGALQKRYQEILDRYEAAAK